MLACLLGKSLHRRGLFALQPIQHCFPHLGLLGFERCYFFPGIVDPLDDPIRPGAIRFYAQEVEAYSLPIHLFPVDEVRSAFVEAVAHALYPITTNQIRITVQKSRSQASSMSVCQVIPSMASAFT